MGNTLASENEVSKIPEPFLDVVQKRSGELRPSAEGGRELVVTDENGVVVKLGKHQEFDIRVERIALADGAGASGMTAHGRLRPIFTEAAEGAKVDEAPVIVRPLSGGLWSIAWCVPAEGGPTITRLVNERFFVGAQSLTTALRMLGVLTDAKANAVAWIVDPIEGETVCTRLEMKGLNVDWTIPKLGLKVSDLLLSVMFPADRDRRYFAGTIKGTIRIGSDLPFVLSNQRSVDNPKGWWLLTPQQASIPLQGFFDWVKTLGLPAPAAALPPWASRLDQTLSVTNLALGVDPTLGVVSLLRGGVVWDPRKGLGPDGALPGGELCASGALASRKPAFQIEEVAACLAVEYPFEPGASDRMLFEFSVKARILAKLFQLSGWARGADDWYLTGQCLEALSITEAIAGLVGAPDKDAELLFADFELSLDQTRIGIGSGGRYSFGSGVLVRRKSGRPFNVGIGQLTIKPASIRIGGAPSGTTYALELAFALEETGGPIFDDIRLALDFSSGRVERSTQILVSSAIRFPTQKPDALGDGDEVYVGLQGTYVSGPAGGFSFTASVGSIKLNPVIESLLGHALPKEFPQLQTTELKLSIDTVSGKYTFTGGVVVGEVAFVLEVEHDGKAGTTTVAAAAVGELKLGGFLRLFGLQDQARDDGQAALAGAGFRYLSTSTNRQFEVCATWGTSGQFTFLLAKDPSQPGEGYRPLVYFRPGELEWLTNTEIRWANVERAVSVFEPPKRAAAMTEKAAALTASTSRQVAFTPGFGGTATLQLERTRLRAPGPITVNLTPAGLTIDLPKTAGSDGPSPIALPPAPAPRPLAGDAAPGDAAAPGDVTLELGGPVSLQKIADAALGSSGGSWTKYLNFLVLDHTGITAHTKPQPAFTVFTDATLNLGSRLSLSAKRAAAKITPQGLSLAGLRKAKWELDLDGAALSLDLRPWVKLDAAVMRDRSKTDLVILGVGKLEILEKIGIGALVYLAWKERILNEGFAFVFATGLALGTPTFKVTGIAGGFGYNCVLELPSQPRDVPDFPIMALMRGSGASEPAASGSEALMRNLVSFKASLKSRERAWCLAFGLTFKIAELVDCATLVVVEIRKPGFELALAGVADLPLRLGDGAALGHVQLGLIARFSSSEGTLKILGALTDKSWLIHPDCRLRGGFALCLWLDGPHRGDFLVSLGGYSPLAPARPHYPALDRVGFTWKPKLSDPRADMVIAGDLYFALDRHGIQFGQSARLHYNSESLVVQAHYSFDVLVQWSPLFFEAQMRIGIHIEVRTFITLRLGLDVDMHAWGPPFGAKVTVCVTVLFASVSYTVEVGPALAAARPVAEIKDVLALALAGRPSLIQIGGGVRKEATRFRPDDMALIVSLAVPVTDVSAAKKERVELRQVAIDIRPMRRQNVRSSLDFTVASVSPNGAETELDPCHWRLGAEPQTPTEALWYYPGDKTDAEKRRMLMPSGRVAITELRIAPPAGSLSTALPVITTPDTAARTLPSAARTPVTGVAWAVLKGAGFDLDDSRTPGSQPDTRGQS